MIKKTPGTLNTEKATPIGQKQPNGSVIIDHNKGSEYQCEICRAKHSISDMADTCSQGHKFCKTCLKTYLTGRIADFRGSGIPCPSDNCTQRFDENLMKTLLDEESMKLYEAKKLEKMVAQDPNTRFCPKPGCSRVIRLSTSKLYTKCWCSSKICNGCGEFWHENKTCEEVRDVGLEVCMKAHLIRRCMMCKTLVENLGTCHNITCPVCDYEWCWMCGEQYVLGHYQKCSKKKKPEPPQEIVNEPPSGAGKIKSALPVLYYILLLPVKFLFMGFFICNNWDAVRSKHVDIDKRVRAFVTVLVGCLAYDAACIGLTLVTFLPIIDGKKTSGLIYLAVLLYLVFVLFLIMDLRSMYKKRKPSKRWQSRNAIQFKIIVKKPQPQVGIRGYEPVRFIGQKLPVEPTRNAVHIFLDSLPTNANTNTNINKC